MLNYIHLKQCILKLIATFFVYCGCLCHLKKRLLLSLVGQSAAETNIEHTFNFAPRQVLKSIFMGVISYSEINVSALHN